MNKETIKLIRKKVKDGMKYREIARELKLSVTTIIYHTSKENKIRRVNQSKEYFNKLPEEKKQRIYKERKDYINNYLKDKYKNDEEYREKKKKYAREYYQKMKGGKLS